MENAVVEFYKKDRLRINRVLIFTFLFGFIAHGYCLFNTNFSHDSLIALNYTNDYEHQIAIGRWLRPVYCMLRGEMTMPVINGLLMLTFLAAAIYLIVLLLDIKSRNAVIVTTAILVTNYSVSLLNASYYHDTDCYMFALMMALLGYSFLEKAQRKLRWVSLLFFVISLALYQAYANVVLTLILAKAMKEIRNNEDILASLKEMVIKGIYLGVSMGLYFVIFKLVLLVLKIESSNAYNAPKVSGFSPYQILLNIYNLLGTEVLWFFTPRNHNSLVVALINLALFAMLAYAVIMVLRDSRMRPKNKLVYILLLCLLPFALNAICMLSGVAHDLMIFSFFLVYVIGFDFVEKHLPKKAGLIAGILLMVMVADNCIYANEVYLKKDLEDKNTLSTITRVIDRIEQTDEYVVGQTPVMFVGLMHGSPLSMYRDGFDYRGAGLWSNFSMTLSGSAEAYFSSYLSYPINLIDFSEEWQENKIIQEMPSFPKNGSCQMVDGVMVVKLSEP